MYGWVCPKCGMVYGPHIDECAACNAANKKHGIAEVGGIPKYPNGVIASGATKNSITACSDGTAAPYSHDRVSYDPSIELADKNTTNGCETSGVAWLKGKVWDE